MYLADMHVHTSRSHHGEGDLSDAIEVAIERGIKVIGFVEHAPFPFDNKNRMTLRETKNYLRDLDRIRHRYEGQIIILKGLEVDYAPSCESYVRQILDSLSYDYALGSIHFVEYAGEKHSIWDYRSFQEPKLVTTYLEHLRHALLSGLFEGIAHPDILLRAGIGEQYMQVIQGLFPIFQRNEIAYEVNCSGLIKTVFDPSSNKMVRNKASYPNLHLAYSANSAGIRLTIGSDAHEPYRIGQNITLVMEQLEKLGIKNLYYFLNQKACAYNISDYPPARTNETESAT